MRSIVSGVSKLQIHTGGEVMKKVLVLSLVVFLALSGAAFAATGGHNVTVVVTPIDTVVIDLPSGVESIANEFAGAEPLNSTQRSELTTLLNNVGSYANRTVDAALLPVLKLPIFIDGTKFAVGVNGSDLVKAFGSNTGSASLGTVDLLLKNNDGKGFTLRKERDLDLSVSAASSKFAIVNSDGYVVETIQNGRTYFVVTELDNGASYILSGNEVSMVLANNVAKKSGGSSGCNAGLPMVAGVVILSGLLFIKRK